MALKLNTYIVDISMILQNYVIPDHVKITDGVQYKYYAILLADSIESAYKACERHEYYENSKFSNFITIHYFYKCIKILNDTKSYSATSNMRWYDIKGDILYVKYELKNCTTNELVSFGQGMAHNIDKYDIDESLYD